MDPTQFGPNSTGRLVETPYVVKAFIPNPLPPHLDYARLTVPLASATQAVGELKGASRRLTNPYILVRPLQRREALTSSAMEGTFTTEDDLLLTDAGITEAKDQASIEVRNYLRALTDTIRLLRDENLPICHKLIRRSHETLLSGVGSHRGAHRAPGQYRDDQNAIGGAKRGIENARFIPPPPDAALKCMDELEAYINRPERDSTPPLIDIGLVHYQLETIHPFSDGNGRVGRMLISVMAVERGLFDTPLLYLSPELEDRKDEYIDLMLKVSTEGAWEDWLEFFLDAVQKSAISSIKVVDRLIKLQESYRERVTVLSRSANPIGLVDMLFESPVITVRDVQDKFSVTYRAARKTIDRLIECKILMEMDRFHPTVFVAPEIMRIADDH